jgi:hypothetical protein
MTKQATTLEDILSLFEQTNAMLKENAAAQAKNAAAQAKNVAAAQARTEAVQAKTDVQMAKTDAKLNKLAELYGGVSDNQGSAAEEFFYNSLKVNPVIGGIKFDRVTPNLIVGAKDKQAEFDMVLVNGNAVALLEIKHKAHLSVLDQLDKQLRRYREVFPEHASYKLYGGIAGLSVPNETIEEAHKRGMFVLKQKGDVFAVDAEEMRPF